MKLNGLNSKQVAQSKRKYGTNTIPGVKRKTAWQFVMETFNDKINLIGYTIFCNIIFGGNVCFHVKIVVLK